MSDEAPARPPRPLSASERADELILRALTRLVEGIDWDDTRRKFWHLGLVLAVSYAAQTPRWQWAVPVLTAAAGISRAPGTR